MGVIQLLTVQETARMLRTTGQQVRKMIVNEELPAVKVGREWRIPMESIRMFLENNLWNRQNEPESATNIYYSNEGRNQGICFRPNLL